MPDDFTRIRGITPKIATRLREAGIERYGALAALRPDEVVELIGTAGGVSIDMIEKRDWIGQARALAPTADGTDHVENELSGRRADFAVALVLNADRTVNHTHVLHLQSGDELQWEGWAERQMLEFMAEQTGLHASLAAQIPSAARQAIATPRPARPTAVEAPSDAGVEPVGKTVGSEASNRLVTSTLQVISDQDSVARHVVAHEQPFTVRVTFALGKLEPKLDRGTAYRATIYAKQLGPGHRSVLRATEGVATSSDQLQVDVADVMLVRGAYRLGAELTLGVGSTTVPTTQYVESSLLQVV